MMNDDDPLRGSDLPPVPPTARPAVPVGKHSVPAGTPGDPRTAAEFAHPPKPLALQAQTLADEVVALRTAATTLTQRTARNETSIIIGAVGLIADIILSVIVFVLLHNQAVSADQLRAQQNQLTVQQAQTETVRHDAICPVYNLVLAGRSATARANYAAGPAAYDTFLNTISNGAAALRCSTP